MKRIAAPMVCGIVTSAILELLLFYVIWRRRALRRSDSAPEIEIPAIS
jgi:Cu/Ag efflux pump CusA